MSRPIAKKLTLIAMGLVILVQAWFIANAYVSPFLAHYRGLSGRSSIERSAQLAYGDRFAGYILFLREHIPEDGLVIQPSFSDDQVFGHQGLMQYFLFPRTVISCPRSFEWTACLDEVGGPHTYIMAVGDFPPQIPPQDGEQYLGYTSDRGLYFPSGLEGANP